MTFFYIKITEAFFPLSSLRHNIQQDGNGLQLRLITFHTVSPTISLLLTSLTILTSLVDYIFYYFVIIKLEIT